MLTRRFILRGLVAAPAVIAADRLMKVRGIILPTIDAGVYNLPLAQLGGLVTYDIFGYMRYEWPFEENSFS